MATAPKSFSKPKHLKMSPTWFSGELKYQITCGNCGEEFKTILKPTNAQGCKCPHCNRLNMWILPVQRLKDAGIFADGHVNHPLKKFLMKEGQPMNATPSVDDSHVKKH